MSQIALPALALARRRRRTAGVPMEKTALTFHVGVLEAVDAAVDAGVAPSRSAFVEAAVAEKLTRTRRVALYQAYAEAAADPGFLADLDAVEQAFAGTTADGLPTAAHRGSIADPSAADAR